MSGTDGSRQGEACRIVAGIGEGRACIEQAAVRDLVNTYLVRSLDTTALRFSVRVLLAAPAVLPGNCGTGNSSRLYVKLKVHPIVLLDPSYAPVSLPDLVPQNFSDGLLIFIGKRC